MEKKTILIKYHQLELKISANIIKRGNKWILCLHGLQTNKELFTELISQPYLKDYSVLAVNFIGFGESSKPISFSYDLLEQAKICKEIINQLGLKEIVIIGHSMGGMVGTLLLDLIPRKITALINMEGNLVLGDCGASKEVAELSFLKFQQTEYQRMKQKIKNSREISSKFRLTAIEKIPDFVFYKTSKSIVEWSESQKLLEIFLTVKQKKLFVYGDQNQFKINSLQGKIASASIKNAGHFMLLDNFEDCSREIQKFLDGLD